MFDGRVGESTRDDHRLGSPTGHNGRVKVDRYLRVLDQSGRLTWWGPRPRWRIPAVGTRRHRWHRLRWRRAANRGPKPGRGRRVGRWSRSPSMDKGFVVSVDTAASPTSPITTAAGSWPTCSKRTPSSGSTASPSGTLRGWDPIARRRLFGGPKLGGGHRDCGQRVGHRMHPVRPAGRGPSRPSLGTVNGALATREALHRRCNRSRIYLLTWRFAVRSVVVLSPLRCGGCSIEPQGCATIAVHRKCHGGT